MATENVTGAVSFPAEPGGLDSGAPQGCGLVDVSASAAEHATGASPSLQREVEKYFARCAQQQAEAAPAQQQPQQQQPAQVPHQQVEGEEEPEPAPAPAAPRQ